MQDKAEKLIKLVYRRWKAESFHGTSEHPDEEALACFMEGKLTEVEADLIKEHLISCEACAEVLALNLTLEGKEMKEVPEEILKRIKGLLVSSDESCVLEIILSMKEKLLEMINTTGDVLVGLELVPAPILRSRSIKDFKDEVTILKDFKDIRVEARIENKGGKVFNLNILIRRKQTQETIKDLRVALIKEGLELESYITDSGTVIFEHVSIGKYTVEISTVENKVATILLDMRA